MTVFEPETDSEGRVVQVRGMDGSLLMTLDTSTMTIEIRRRGVLHRLRLHHLIAFAQASQRVVFRAETAYGADDIVSQRFE